jgi:hypothetical protein
MPEHTITESRGRNKWGHRSYDTRKFARFPSPVRLIIGNIHDLRDFGRARAKLGNRISRRYQIHKDVNKAIVGEQTSESVINNHCESKLI